MARLSLILTKKFIKNNIIAADRKEIYKTGIELILANLINIMLILIIGLITKSFLYSCIYLMTFWTVRRFSGGFHAKTYGVCRIVTVGSYAIVFLISQRITQNYIIYAVVFDATTILTMLLFSPIHHPNKELTSVEIKANKLFSLLTAMLYSVISIILILFSRREGLIISLTLIH